MQSMILPDYLLGNAFSSKYKDTFVAESPMYIYSLLDIEFIRDSLGNYQFKERNEMSEPFIQMSHYNKSLGNFFILFQRYMKSNVNLIQSKSVLFDSGYVYDKEITCYIKPRNLKDDEGETIKDAFVTIQPDTGEVIIIYFYGGSNQVGHLRTNIMNIAVGMSVRNHDKQILAVVQEYQSKNYKPNKDIIKDKYKGRFTEMEYIII